MWDCGACVLMSLKPPHAGALDLGRDRGPRAAEAWGHAPGPFKVDIYFFKLLLVPNHLSY